MNAMATESFRFCPPDSVPTAACSLSLSPTSCTLAATSAASSFRGSPLNRAYMVRCSHTVISGHRMSYCGHKPSDCRMLPSPVARSYLCVAVV